MNKIFNLKNCIIAAVIFVVLMVVGSIYDYQISLLVYHGFSNTFCDFIACVGFLPSCFAAMAGGILICNSDTHKYKLVTFVKRFCLFGCTVFAFYYLFDEYTENSDKYLGLIVLEVILVLFSCFIYQKTLHYKQKNKMVLFGLFLCSLSCAQILVNLCFKHFWLRARMYYVYHSGYEYHAWFELDNAYLENLISIGIPECNFESFPSGHATNSCTLTALWILPYFFKKLKGNEKVLFWIGMIFTLIVCFTRVWSGNHFLTDITIGVYISLVTQLICYEVYLKNFLKKS